MTVCFIVLLLVHFIGFSAGFVCQIRGRFFPRVCTHFHSVHNERERHFFGENGRPAGYVVPTYRIVPENIYFYGPKEKIVARGFKSSDSDIVQAQRHRILVCEDGLIHPRGRSTVGLHGIVFNTMTNDFSHLWELKHEINKAPQLTVLPMGTVIPEGLQLSQPLLLFPNDYCLEPSTPCTVRGFNKLVKGLCGELKMVTFEEYMKNVDLH